LILIAMRTIDHNDTQEFSDEAIRRFLLGTLSPTEQPLFEQRFISDASLDARARLIELDLADEYAGGRLPPLERKLFEQRFLVTADRQRMLRVSELLRDRFSSFAPVSLAKKDSMARRLSDFLGLGRPVWRIAFGALIILLLLGTVVLVVKEPRLPARIARKLIPRRSAPRSAPREAGHPNNISSPEHATTPSPMPLHDSATQPIQTLELFPSAPNIGKLPTVILSNGESDVLRLELAVTANPTAPYRVEVLTIGGQSVVFAGRLQGPPFVVDVPMRSLKSGKYQVRLSDARDASRKEVASYYFQVQ
jgi:hypothetical protein